MKRFLSRAIADVMAIFGIFLYIVTSRSLDDPFWAFVVGVGGIVMSLQGFQRMIQREIREYRTRPGNRS